MTFKDNFDALWNTKSDKEIAISIRAEAEAIYDEIVKWISTVQANTGIDINADIRADFADLLGVMQGCKSNLQAFAASHPEFMNWRPPR